MAKQSPGRTYVPLDGGWGWMVVMASFFAVFLMGTCITSFAVLYPEFIIAFDLTQAEGAWIGSAQFALAFVNNIPAGVLVHRFGCRPVAISGFLLTSAGLIASSWSVNYIMLFLTYGVVAGCGLGLCMLPVFVCVQQYFDRRRAIAVGLALCGINLSSFITGPVMMLLIRHYGWRGSVLLHGGVMLNGILFGSAFRPLTLKKPTEGATDSDEATPVGSCWKSCLDLFDLEILKNKCYILYVVGNFLVNFSGMTFHQHIVIFGRLRGVDSYRSSFLPTVLGICSTISRVISGCIADSKCVNRRYLCAAAAVFGGCVVSFAFLGIDFITIAVIAGLYGFASGSFTTLQNTVLVDLLGVARIAQAQAFFSAFMGSSVLFAGPLAGIFCSEYLPFMFASWSCVQEDMDAEGFLVDRTGSYDIPFVINGLLHVTGGAIIIVVGYIHMEELNTGAATLAAVNGHVARNGHCRLRNNNNEDSIEKVELMVTTV